MGSAVGYLYQFCLSLACHFDLDPDPDPTFHYDADADPDPSFQLKAQKQNLEKGSNRLIFHTLGIHSNGFYLKK